MNEDRKLKQPRPMALRDWELYHIEALEQTREHIAKRGPEDPAHPGAEEQHECEFANWVSEVRFTNGYIIYPEGDDWHIRRPDGSVVMNHLDGETPFSFGYFFNALGDLTMSIELGKPL